MISKPGKDFSLSTKNSYKIRVCHIRYSIDNIGHVCPNFFKNQNFIEKMKFFKNPWKIKGGQEERATTSVLRKHIAFVSLWQRSAKWLSARGARTVRRCTVTPRSRRTPDPQEGSTPSPLSHNNAAMRRRHSDAGTGCARR